MNSRLKKRINIYRRYKYWNNSGCIYIHIPKVAGTSINHALYGRTLGHYSADEISRTFPRMYRRCFSFTFVRNPWARVVSAYRFAKQGGTSSMRIDRPERYRIPEFESFERFVLDWLPKQDVYTSDYVFMPQYKFIVSFYGEPIVDFVGKIERINVDIGKVESKIKRTLALQHMNSTNSDSSYVGFYKNKKMVDVVGDVYQKDVAMFNYVF